MTLRHLLSRHLRGLSRFFPRLRTRRCNVFLRLKYWPPPKVWLRCVKSSSIIAARPLQNVHIIYIYIMWSISLPVSESGLRPSKCVKTNTDVPVEIPTPRLVWKMARWHETIWHSERVVVAFCPRLSAGLLDCDVKKSDQCYHKSSHLKGLSAWCNTVLV